MPTGSCRPTDGLAIPSAGHLQAKDTLELEDLGLVDQAPSRHTRDRGHHIYHHFL